MGQAKVLRSLERIGAEVIPLVEKALAGEQS